MKIRFLLFSLFLLSCIAADAQKYLQIERLGKKKLIKFYPGDEFTFRLKGEKIYYTLPIKDLRESDRTIVFNNGEVKLDDIDLVKMVKHKGTVKAWTLTFVNFGLAWGLFTLIDVAVGGSFTVGGLIVMGTSIGIGLLIKAIFSKRKYKMGKRRQLRIINLNLSPADIPVLNKGTYP